MLFPRERFSPSPISCRKGVSPVATMQSVSHHSATEAAPGSFYRTFGGWEHFVCRNLPHKHLTTACFRQLDHALLCLRALTPEASDPRKLGHHLEYRTTLYITSRSCSADQPTWVRWEEGVDVSGVLPRIAVLVEASDLIALRKKSSYFHQSLTLIGKIVDEFAGDCEVAA